MSRFRSRNGTPYHSAFFARNGDNARTPSHSPVGYRYCAPRYSASVPCEPMRDQWRAELPDLDICSSSGGQKCGTKTHHRLSPEALPFHRQLPRLTLGRRSALAIPPADALEALPWERVALESYPARPVWEASNLRESPHVVSVLAWQRVRPEEACMGGSSFPPSLLEIAASFLRHSMGAAVGQAWKAIKPKPRVVTEQTVEARRRRVGCRMKIASCCAKFCTRLATGHPRVS